MINLAIYNYDGNTWSLVDNDTPFVVFMISPFSNSVQALFMTQTGEQTIRNHTGFVWFQVSGPELARAGGKHQAFPARDGPCALDPDHVAQH